MCIRDRLHAVAAHNEIEVAGRVLDPGILLAVVFLIGQRAVARLDRAEDVYKRQDIPYSIP